MRTAEFFTAAATHNPDLARGAARYAQQMGQSHPGPAALSQVYAHPLMMRAMQRAYMSLPEYDPDAEPAFRTMRDETNNQFDYLTRPRARGGMGVHVEVTKQDPYEGPAAMMRDLASNDRLRVMSTAETGGHPFFSDEENDRFRAVHDAFGHAATGRGFDPHGEEAAFQSHAAMYSPRARRALVPETRGQNSSLNLSGSFQPQKVALMPQRFEPVVLRPGVGRRSAQAGARAALQSRQFHLDQFHSELPVRMP